MGEDVILTASDLALFCDRNPALLLRLVRDASCIAELAPLLRQGSRMVLDALAHSSDVDDCTRIATELVAAAGGPLYPVGASGRGIGWNGAALRPVLLAGIRRHGAGRNSAAGASQDRRGIRRAAALDRRHRGEPLLQRGRRAGGRLVQRLRTGGRRSGLAGRRSSLHASVRNGNASSALPSASPTNTIYSRGASSSICANCPAIRRFWPS